MPAGVYCDITHYDFLPATGQCVVPGTTTDAPTADLITVDAGPNGIRGDADDRTEVASQTEDVCTVTVTGMVTVTAALRQPGSVQWLVLSLQNCVPFRSLRKR